MMRDSGGAVFSFSDAALPRANGPYEGLPYANYFLAPNYKINDLIAAVLLTQLKKVDGYIANKIRAAQQIIEGLADIEEITPQRVRPGDRNTYWVLGFTIDTDRLNCSAGEFAEAVSREGVPLSGPYIGSGKEGPLYRNPFLAEPDCYGRTRFPFDYEREKPIDYRLDRMSVWRRPDGARCQSQYAAPALPMRILRTSFKQFAKSPCTIARTYPPAPDPRRTDPPFRSVPYAPGSAA